jgi:hypothetical protein
MRSSPTFRWGRRLAPDSGARAPPHAPSCYSGLRVRPCSAEGRPGPHAARAPSRPAAAPCRGAVGAGLLHQTRRHPLRHRRARGGAGAGGPSASCLSRAPGAARAPRRLPRREAGAGRGAREGRAPRTRPIVAPRSACCPRFALRPAVPRCARRPPRPPSLRPTMVVDEASNVRVDFVYEPPQQGGAETLVLERGTPEEAQVGRAHTGHRTSTGGCRGGRSQAMPRGGCARGQVCTGEITHRGRCARGQTSPGAPGRGGRVSRGCGGWLPGGAHGPPDGRLGVDSRHPPPQTPTPTPFH